MLPVKIVIPNAEQQVVNNFASVSCSIASKPLPDYAISSLDAVEQVNGCFSKPSVSVE